MNARTVRVGAMLLGAMLMLPGPGQASAQQAPARPAGPGRAMRPMVAEVQAWFDAMVVVQAQKALGLSDEKYQQFVGRLKALQQARRRSAADRNRVLATIGRLTNPNRPAADEALLRDRLRELEDVQTKGAAEVRRAYDELDQVLDLRQRARFRVFEEQIEMRKFEFLLNARRPRAGAVGR